jgi:isoleucyl-tRNA synthetase
VLHRIWELDTLVRQAIYDFDFHHLFVAVSNFCTVDLSAFYFDIRKDALYCDPADSLRRRAARTVLDELLSCLTAWLAPIHCFTAEEAWLARHPDAESVHLRTYPEIPESWRNDELAQRWTAIRRLRRVVTGALEVERKEKKRIGASLQGRPVVHAPADYAKWLEGIDLAEVCITSDAEFTSAPAPEGAFMLEEIDDIAVVVDLAEGEKCGRCWMVLPEVAHEGGVCRRCEEAVKAADAA